MQFRFDSYCGLYCGACGVIHAVEKGTLDAFAAKWNSTAEKMECHGCKSDHLAEFAENCKIRKCALERGHEFCIECEDFQCERFMDFLDAQAAHPRIHFNNLERIEEAGVETWLTEQDKRWRCSNCGGKFHFDQATCIQCGKEVYNLLLEAEDMKKKG
jgi:hypothetical protein